MTAAGLGDIVAEAYQATDKVQGAVQELGIRVYTEAQRVFDYIPYVLGDGPTPFIDWLENTYHQASEIFHQVMRAGGQMIEPIRPVVHQLWQNVNQEPYSYFFWPAVILGGGLLLYARSIARR